MCLTEMSATPQTVILIGFMGAGKTSVGKALSRRLGWEFDDLDDRVMEREARSIEEIFRSSGEIHFRYIEHEALRNLLSDSQPGSRIIALGGGAFVQGDNRSLIEASGGKTVFLDAPVEELWQRCQTGQPIRPLRGDFEQFRQLYEQRRPCYLRASLRVETGDKDVETIAAEVESSLCLR